MKKLMMMALIISMPMFGFSQLTFSGRIIDEQTREPLVGAHVIIEQTFLSTVTDNEGTFRFNNLRQVSVLLKISFLGYDDYYDQVDLKQNQQLEIALRRCLIMEDEVVISATRMPVQSPATFTNMDKEEIRKNNLGRDLPFLLETSPSLVTTSDAGSGIGYTGLKIRGTDITRINVTVNGIPLNDPESHGVYWVNLPDLASSIESIQIQRGVGTSVNGASTFGGSINIQTQALRAEPYADISSSAGSFNTLKNSVSLGAGLLNNMFTVDARFSKINSDGYIDRAFADLTSFFIAGGYYSDNTIVKLNIFSGKESTYQAWNGIPYDSLKTNRTYNPSGRYVDGNGNIAWYDNETDNYNQDHYQLFFSHNINRGLNVNLAAFHVRGFGYYENYKQDETFSKYGLDDVIIGIDTVKSTDLIRRKYLDNNFYGSTFSVNFNSFKRLKATLGGGFNYYDGDHYGTVIWANYASNSTPDRHWYENNGIKREYNLYGKVYYLLTKKVNGFADLQVRGIDYKINGIHDDLSDISQNHDFLFFNPKFGVMFDLNQQHRSYLSFAIANREPTRSDFRDADADNQPRPERLYNLEVGHNFTLNNFKLNANVFYMDYKDQLVLTGKINNVGNPVFVNAPESYRIGFELVIGWKPLPWLRWDGNVSVSENKIRNFTEYVDNWSPPYEQITANLGETDISFSPSVVAAGNLAFLPSDKLSLSLVSKYVGKQYIDNTSSNSRSLNSYFVNDIRINYSVATGLINGIDLFLTVANIFDSKYESNAWVYRYNEEGAEYQLDGYFPQAGINFLAGFTLRF